MKIMKRLNISLITPWIIFGILGSSLIFFVLVAGYREYNIEKQKAALEAENMSLVLEQYVRSTFEKFDLLLLHAQDILINFDTQKLSTEKLSRLSYQMKRSVPEAEILAIADSKGNQIGNSNWIKNDGRDFRNEKIYIGDRPYYLQQQNESNTDVVYSSPITSRTTGNLIINISRKLRFPDGNFKGIVFVTLNLQTFSNLFYKLNQNDDNAKNVMALYTLDKIVLARSPFDKAVIGKQFLKSLPFVNELSLNKTHGNEIHKAAVDGIERIYGYKVVGNLPMVIIVGKELQHVFNVWWQRQGISFLLLALIIVISIIGIILYLKKLHEAEEQRLIALQSTKMSMLGEMSAELAHEVMTPLAVIRLHSESMLTALTANRINVDRLISSTQKIDNMCTFITKIMSGLKSYSRDSSLDPMQATALHTIIETAKDLTSIRFKHNFINIYADPCPQVMVHCREAQITQVIINILNNASDAITTKPNAWVKIDFIMIGKRIQILITDCGKGIPPEIALKLMTPFFTTKPVNKGTGLGLSISKKIVEEHGGSLKFDVNCPNTRFIVELPAEPF